MATDATGTPTSGDSIPKYNVSVDKPSGLGFNAAMDQIQTALNLRLKSTDTPATNEVPVWNGSAWVYQKLTASSFESSFDPTYVLNRSFYAGFNTSTSETAIYSYSVPGGTIGQKALHVAVNGRSQTSSGTLTIRVKFGGTTHWGDTVSTLASLTPFSMSFYIWSEAGSTGNVSHSLAGQIFTPCSTAGAGSVAGWGSNSANNGADPVFGSSSAFTLNNNNAQTLEISAQFSVSSATCKFDPTLILTSVV